MGKFFVMVCFCIRFCEAVCSGGVDPLLTYFPDEITETVMSILLTNRFHSAVNPCHYLTIMWKCGVLPVQQDKLHLFFLR